MARPKKDTAPDLAQRITITAGAIERLTCPPGKQQVFMRDTEAPALRVRCTMAGAKSYTFEAKLSRQTIRITIGDVRSWTLDAARTEAKRLSVLVDGGQDPREVQREQLQALEERRQQRAAQAVTVGDVWRAYLQDRQPFWGERHHADHVKLTQPGGEPARRGVKVQPGQPHPTTAPGPLFPLLGLPLSGLNAATIDAWANQHAKTRPTVARLGLRCLKAFLSWCSEHPDYVPALPDGNPAKSRKAREVLGKAGVKTDALLKEQLPAWFAAVRQLPNATISAYLQTLLLTGARPGEVLTLKWEDVNTQWRGLTIRDKVEGERVIPLTPYVHHLIAALPRRGEYVFASARSDGPVTHPTKPHTTACKVAGVDGLTLHGLRRSFKSLTEWLEVPAGVVAQIMGHKPSATAEKHYTVRPLDLLRIHHEKIEAWMLEQAGVKFNPNTQSTTLRLVA